MAEPLRSRPGTEFVCECPSGVSRLEIENDCLIAILDTGAKFLVPTPVEPGNLKN